jgi:hypothetical protein
VGNPALTALLESDEEFLLKAQFLPDDQARRYVAGDVIRLEGMLSESVGASPEVATEVTARLKILPTVLEQEGAPVLLAELVVWGPTGELLHNWSLQFWQDEFGGIHQRTDENGNVLLDTAANMEGIPLVPVPMEPLAYRELPFAAMWGGHTSGPLTSAERLIETGEPQTRTSPSGELLAYPVRVADEITYLTSYVDFRRDQTISDAYLLWMSREKGVVALEVQRQVYSATGRLLASRQLNLDVVRFRF